MDTMEEHSHGSTQGLLLSGTILLRLPTRVFPGHSSGPTLHIRVFEGRSSTKTEHPQTVHPSYV